MKIQMFRTTVPQCIAMLGMTCAVAMTAITVFLFSCVGHYVKLFPDILQLASSVGDALTFVDSETGSAKMALRDGGELFFECGSNILRGKIIRIRRIR